MSAAPMALSILQPFAWLIVRPDVTDPADRALLAALDLMKTIENRSWRTHVRGEVLIHAGKAYTRNDHAHYADFIPDFYGVKLPAFGDLERGGIVGRTQLVDCVTASRSRWFNGPFGFVLRDTQPLAFRPLLGRQRFFRVP